MITDKAIEVLETSLQEVGDEWIEGNTFSASDYKGCSVVAVAFSDVYSARDWVKKVRNKLAAFGSDSVNIQAVEVDNPDFMGSAVVILSTIDLCAKTEL